MIHLILLILAFLLFIFAGLGITYGRLQFGWFGLASLTLSMIVTR